MDTLERFAHDRFIIRRQFFTLFGAAFHLTGGQDRPLFYCRQKAFKLREDIRLYADASMQQEALVISAREIIDFGASYDVVDPADGQTVGSLRRKGLGSLFRDQWRVFDAHGAEIGRVIEDSAWQAMVRRVLDLSFLFPQTFHAEVGGARACTFKQRFNPIIFKLDVSFEPGDNGLDRRLGLAAGVLLAAIEGRQQ